MPGIHWLVGGCRRGSHCRGTLVDFCARSFRERVKELSDHFMAASSTGLDGRHLEFTE